MQQIRRFSGVFIASVIKWSVSPAFPNTCPICILIYICPFERSDPFFQCSILSQHEISWHLEIDHPLRCLASIFFTEEAHRLFHLFSSLLWQDREASSSLLLLTASTNSFLAALTWPKISYIAGLTRLSSGGSPSMSSELRSSRQSRGFVVLYNAPMLQYSVAIC